MRLVHLSVILLFLSFGLKAQSVLDKELSIDLQQTTAQEAIDELGKIAEVEFSYSKSFFNSEKKLDLKVENRSLKFILDKILTGTGVQYKASGNRIILFKKKGKRSTVSGYVEDKDTGERLISATVFSSSHGQGVITNEYGFFSISLDNGPATLEVRFVGYQPMSIEMDVDGDQNTTIKLASNSMLSEVTVSGRGDHGALFDQDANKETLINPQFVEASPSLGGEEDYLRTLQILPGVNGGVDGLGGIIVRGGNGGQNLMLLDGVPVYIPYHLMGTYSIYNPSTVNSAKFIKGSFPARYGGRISSFVDVRTRDGNKYEWKALGSVSLVNAGFMAEGPLVKDKSSVMVAARYAPEAFLFDRFFKRAYFQNVESNLNTYFYDLNVKLNYSLSQNDRIYLSFFSGRDEFTNSLFEEEEEEAFDSEVQFDWGNITSSFRWNHLYNSKLFSNTTLTYSRYGFTFSSLEDIRRTEGEEAENELYFISNSSQNQDAGVRVDFDYFPNERNTVRFGGGYSLKEFIPELTYFESDDEEVQNLDTVDLESLENLAEGDVERVSEFYAYVEEKLQIGRNWHLNLGLRGTGFAHQDRMFFNLEPRFFARYRVSRDLSFNLSGDRMVQYLHLISNSAIRLPNDLWIPSSDDLTPQTSWQWEVGSSYRISDQLALSTDVYLKNMSGLYAYPDSLSFLENVNELEPGDYLVVGTGKAYGIENMLRYTGKTRGGILSYALSRAERQFADKNGGRVFPYDFDQRHRIKIFVYQNIGSSIQLGLNWIFMSPGPQINLVVTEFGAGLNRVQLNPDGNLNSRRIEPYHRLDFSFSYTLRTAKTEHRLKFGLYNLYNRQNTAHHQIDYDDDDVPFSEAISSISIAPAIFYSISF